jgi:Putative cyclase
VQAERRSPWQVPLVDDLFDPHAVEAGAWSPGPYGAGDRLGTYHEVGPEKYAAALSLLDLSRPLRTFDLGYRLYAGFPGYSGRRYEIQLEAGTEPIGDNRLTHLEERVCLSMNLGAKINGLHHAGVGDMYYGDRRLPDLIAAKGVDDLDTPTWGPPLLTRGFLIDVVADKVARGDHSALTTTVDGRPSLGDHYRITVEDLESAIDRQDLPPFEPGDAILIFTGSSRHGFPGPGMPKQNPGVWLREVRWLARFVPALLGSDTVVFGTDNRDVARGCAAAPHQELFIRFGIRLGETINLDELATAQVDRFAFCHNPFRGDGVVSSNTPAMAIGNAPSRPEAAG